MHVGITKSFLENVDSNVVDLGGVWDYIFLSGSHVMLRLVVHKPHFEKQGHLPWEKTQSLKDIDKSYFWAS